MCPGSAARALYEAETLEQQTMHLHKCDHVFFLLGKKKWGGGGVVRLTAKPRYLLLLHRGEKKSNTVTALETAFSFPRWLVGLVTLYISDERWAEIALRDWEIASLSQSVELRQAASSQIVHLNIK